MNVNGVRLSLIFLTYSMEQSRVGVLSPDFFAIYIDDLILILKQSGIGCHILNIFLACIPFADDMSLLDPTRDALPLRYCKQFCLQFNVKKTKVIVFEKISRHLDTLLLIIKLSIMSRRGNILELLSGLCSGFRGPPQLGAQ
jgi:hypothetical protein